MDDEGLGSPVNGAVRERKIGKKRLGKKGKSGEKRRQGGAINSKINISTCHMWEKNDLKRS